MPPATSSTQFRSDKSCGSRRGRGIQSSAARFKTFGATRTPSQCRWPPTRIVSMVWLLLAGCNMLEPADSLRFTSIQMPALVQRGTNFWLSCQYELQSSETPSEPSAAAAVEPVSSEQLYSVKWYKNNEEFYRIIFGPSAGADAGQQQYFTQPGVNVLMSSSNATHVRLLNGSLESEGAFACEISTQNLSTIRFEKEIKVYVLPSAGLALVGLRSFYALGDKVELQCLSDFSRPAGALAWFIGGRRVITTNSSQLQVGETANEPSASEPKLSRSRLTLKFKLTSELLASGLASSPSSSSSSSPSWSWSASLRARPQTLDGNNINQQQLLPHPERNQSKSPPLSLAAQIQTGRLLELMRLECRYKLAEVSDVTFAELKVGTPRLTGSGAAGRQQHRRQRLRRRAPSRRRLSAQAGRDIKLGLSKTLANQVQQTHCLVERNHLLELIAAGSDRDAAACSTGLLALQREDPVLLEAGELGSDHLSDDNEGRPESEPANDRLELAPDSTIGVNCSTLGALLADGARQWPAASNEYQEATMNFCGDPEARRRLLISSKYQGDTSEAGGLNQRRRKQPVGSATNSNNPNHNHHHIAYVSVDRARQLPNGSAPSDHNASGRQQQPSSAGRFVQGDKLSLQAESSNAGKSLGQLHDNTSRSSSGGSNSNNMQLRSPTSAWLAPPLLEWFINNQEAPKSSAVYSPELPLVSAVSAGQRGLRNQKRLRRRMAAPSADTDEALEDEQGETAIAGRLAEQTLELPSIDYREYFANFDSHPIDRHLVLRLVLEKKHFMTPDSLLRLRCTSTQAQVLAVDSLDVSLFLLANSANLNSLAGSIAEHKPDEQRRAGPAPSMWLQRQQTIKAKHIHRQSVAPQFSSPVSRQDQANGAAGSRQTPSAVWTALLQLLLLHFVWPLVMQRWWS